MIKSFAFAQFKNLLNVSMFSKKYTLQTMSIPFLRLTSVYISSGIQLDTRHFMSQPFICIPHHPFVRIVTRLTHVLLSTENLSNNDPE
jgi:hypothetical protein